MAIGQEQAQRFFNTLAMLVARREGVNIKVTVTPRKEEQQSEFNAETYSSVPQYGQMRVS